MKHLKIVYCNSHATDFTAYLPLHIHDGAAMAWPVTKLDFRS
jgi:hypothetical protein